MTTIEPVKSDLQHPQNVKKNSLHIRIWHWLNFIVISGSLLTVLLNETILDRKSVPFMISEQFSKSGIAANQAAAGDIAHELNENVWSLHRYIGLLLAALFLYRLIAEYILPRPQLFFNQLKTARALFKDRGLKQYLGRHEFTVKLLYLGFYVALSVIVVTGLVLFFREPIGLSGDFAHEIKEIHGFCMYLIIAFIVVHLAGVVLAELKRSPGIVSDMINGGKDSHYKNS